MEKSIFIEDIIKLLQEMPIEKKDEWILMKAKLVSESEQKDFIMSLTEEKKITYMPTETEIEEFCEKVNNGDVYVEYETHYYEFNSEGRYVDDWEVHHNDPQNAFSFLDRIFRGCHDLMRLGEYKLAGNILDKVCQLEFQVVEAEDSEDFEDDSPFTIADAVKENLLTMNTREIGYDWIEALLLGEEDNENLEFAKKLVGILELELCKGVNLSDYAGIISERLLEFIEQILEDEVRKIHAALKNISGEKRQWREAYAFEKKKARNQHLLLDLQKKCRNRNNILEKSMTASVLQASWKQISELLQILRYERYIDDQLEIDEVWNICEALIKRDRFEEEDWRLRKRILEDMVSHGYYECYGCYDPIKDLSKKLYITEDEILAFADMLNEHEHYAREAADLYREHGRMEQYVQYLETHLDKSSKEYLELIDCYCNNGNEAGARCVAQQGLENCKDELTDLFIFLLKDAKKYGETEKYKKLYASAKRRKKADIARIDKNL